VVPPEQTQRKRGRFVQAGNVKVARKTNPV
jgi:hypothetical protein